MDSENLHLAIMSNEQWGNKVSENDSFYRLLFKLDKVREQNETLKTEDVLWLFASYRKWFIKAQKLLNECCEDNAGNREALAYREQLKVDIIQHVLDIINESKLENNDLHNDLKIKADIERARIEREAKEAQTEAKTSMGT